MKVKNGSRRPGHGSNRVGRIPRIPVRVPCSHCRETIPRSAAINPEAGDYALYFCGLRCYRRWLSTHEWYRLPADGNRS